MHSAMSHRTSCLQSCKQEEIGVVGEGNILARFRNVTVIKYTKLDNRRRINWSSIGGGFRLSASLVKWTVTKVDAYTLLQSHMLSHVLAPGLQTNCI